MLNSFGRRLLPNSVIDKTNSVLLLGRIISTEFSVIEFGFIINCGLCEGGGIGFIVVVCLTVVVVVDDVVVEVVI